MLAVDGSADTYTRALHTAITNRCLYFGASLIAAAVVLTLARRRLSHVVHIVAEDFAALWSKEKPAFRAPQAGGMFGYLALVVLVLVGAYIRLACMNTPMRYDEAYTFLHYVREPFLIGISKYTAPNNHVFHTLLAHLSYVLFGDSPYAIRLPALLASIATLPLCYLLFKEIYDRDTALLGTGLVATSTILIKYGADARGYSLVTFFFILGLLIANRLRQEHRPFLWIGLSGSTALGLWTIPTMLYAGGAIYLWLLLSVLLEGTYKGTMARFAKWYVASGVLAGVIALLCYMPVFIYADISQIKAHPTVASKLLRLPLHDVLWQNVDVLHMVARQWNSHLFPGSGIVLLFGAVVGLLWNRRISSTVLPLLLVTVVTCAVVVFMQGVVPFARVWTFINPVYLAAAAAGILTVVRRLPMIRKARPQFVGMTLAAAVVGAGAVWLWGGGALRLGKEGQSFYEADRVVSYIRPRLKGDDKIVLMGFALVPFQYYCERRGLDYYKYVYDYAVLDWGALRHTKGDIYIIVLQKQSLSGIVEEAGLGGYSTEKLPYDGEVGLFALRGGTS